MTMTRSQSSPSSMQTRNIEDDSSPQQVSANVRGATPQSIKALLLADGWHNVQDCQLVQFVIGEAQSPISATKFYPYLTYTEGQRTVYTPIGQVLGFDIAETQQGGKSTSQLK
jgi:hypothetical protein